MSKRALGVALLWAWGAATNTFGTVQVLAPDNTPLPEAHVEVLVPGASPIGTSLQTLYSGTTDLGGKVPFRPPAIPGTVVLVDHPSHAPAAAIVHAGEPHPDRIRLDSSPHWSGAVRSDAEGFCFAKGSICLSGRFPGVEEHLQRRWKRCSSIEESGDFSVSGTGPLPWEVTVIVPGHPPLVREVVGPTPMVFALESGGVEIRGSVADEDGDAIKGALVRGGLLPVETNENGEFFVSLRELPATLRFSRPGFVTQDVVIAAGDRSVAVSLEPAPALVAAVLVEEGPYSGAAQVWLQPDTVDAGRHQVFSRSITVVDGSLVVPILQPGSYTVTLRVEGYEELRFQSIQIDHRARTSLGTLVLNRGLGFKGLVVDEGTGLPVPGVLVEAIPVGSSFLALALARRTPMAVTDDGGEFVQGGLRPARYLISFRHSAFAPRFQLVDIIGFRDLGTVSLGPGVVVHGVITNLAKAPKPRTELKLFDPAREVLNPLVRASSDEMGRYRLPPISPGRYRLEIWENRLLHVEEVEFPRKPGLELNLNIGGVKLTGVVRHRGIAVSGGMIRVSNLFDRTGRSPVLRIDLPTGHFVLGADSTHGHAEVELDGTFRLEDAPSGPVWLEYSSGAEKVSFVQLIPRQAEFFLPLELPESSIEGHVLDQAGSGLRGVVAALDTRQTLEVARVETGIHGHFRFSTILPGTYDLLVTSTGHLPQVVRNVTISGETRLPPIVMTAGSGGTIRMELRRPDGIPISMIPVFVYSEQNLYLAGGYTKYDGSLDLPVLPAGDYCVGWSDPLAGVDSTCPVQISEGRVTTVRPVVAEEGCSITLACPLLHCAGELVEFLSIKGRNGFDHLPLLSGATPSLRFPDDGELSLGRLAPGRYTVTLGVDGERYETATTVVGGHCPISF